MAAQSEHNLPPISQAKPVRLNPLEAISIVGSVASIIGLGIVILQEATKEHPIRYSQFAWRITIFGIALTLTSASLVSAFVFVKNAWLDTTKSEARRAIDISARLVLGLVLFGVCFDGLVASIYWTYWLSAPADFLLHEVPDWFRRISSSS